MPVDVGEREFLTEPVPLSLVRLDVDRLREQERLVESIELLLNRLSMPLGIGGLATDLGFALLPRSQDAFLDQPHVAGRRLQQLQLVGEQTFELRS